MRIPTKPAGILICTFALLLLAGCQRYAVSINEQPVYTPPILFSDFLLLDPQLSACVEQTITDQQIEDPEQLKELNCSSAGALRLGGIEVFEALQSVNLRGNALVELSPLLELPKLETLYLDAEVQDCSTLESLRAEGVIVEGGLNCAPQT